MDRRNFIGSAGLGLLGLGVHSKSVAKQPLLDSQVHFSITENRISFHSKLFKEPIKLFFLSDTHLWKSDEREAPYREYSKRMAGAYNETVHFQTGKPTHPSEGFEAVLQQSLAEDADLLGLVGDIFSYPSEAAIEWVKNKLDETKIPYLYTGGNHDWHYEGMDGSLVHLREKWIEARLKPLYNGDNPLITCRDVKSVRFIILDNSIYEILPSQLEAYRMYADTDLPIVLMAHIPFYVPGRPVSFGCGHPQWNAANDKIFEIERRPRWPEAGHTSVTYTFYNELFATSNLLGVFCGHIHSPSLDIINGIPQVVAPPNLAAGYLDIRFLPV